FIVSPKSSYELKLRTWVGGDKDGHPGVDHHTMKHCLQASRIRIIGVISRKIATVVTDLKLLESVTARGRSDIDKLRDLQLQIEKLSSLSKEDGPRVRKWRSQFESLMQ